MDLSRWALQCAGNLAVTLRLDVGRIDGFLPRFAEALQSTDRASAYHAAVILSDVAPFTEGIAEVLVDNLGTREDALPSLVRLGPQAAAAVPKLAENLQARASNAHAAIRRSGPGSRYEDGIAETILSIIEQCAPAGGEAVPVLQKMAETEGFYQERARQLIDRFRVAPAQPADAGGQTSPDGGQ